MLPRPLSNPPNPWASTSVEYLEEIPSTQVQVFIDHSQTILNKNESPDLPFSWTVNPYRGCMHACAYCYARPYHEYLDFGAGTDFDTKIVIKPGAPALLREAFDRRSWQGETLMFSGVTDCYQPLEASLLLTRGCLLVCAEYRNPVSIITKAPLIERDIDVLRELSLVARAHVTLSIPFLDPVRARAIEPYVATPQRRLRTMERLAQSGIEVGVNVAPIIPGLNDHEMVPILNAAREAGATHAGYTLLRLPGSVRTVFEERLRAKLPLAADKVLHRIRETRGGKLYDSTFGVRFRGEGEYAALIGSLFQSGARRAGLQTHGGAGEEASPPTPFRRPPGSGERKQMSLFE